MKQVYSMAVSHFIRAGDASSRLHSSGGAFRNLFRSILVRAVLIAAVAGCTPLDGRSSGTPPGERITITSLEEFERKSPQCESWTNWQKACSRTGENGEVLCRDSALKVDASEPFCVAETGESYGGLPTNSTPSQRASFNRFCEEFESDPHGGGDRCWKWKRDRPFDGRRLSEREHPWCQRWALAIDPRVNPELSEELGFYCASRSIPDWCEWVDGLGNGPQDDAPINTDPEAVIIPAGPLDPTSRAINAPHCRRKK